MMLQRIGTLAGNTIREAIRNRLLYTLLFFAIALIGTGVLVSNLSYVEGERILQDVGLAAIRLMSVGIGIFVGVGLIYGEIERRTLYTILSKPVSRVEFLLGKYLGLVLTTWLMLVVMGIAFAGVSLGYGAPLDGGHVTAFGLIAIELVVMIAVATLFSAFTTPVLASSSPWVSTCSVTSPGICVNSASRRRTARSSLWRTCSSRCCPTSRVST